MSLWAELKRRKVFRVGGAYVVVAWLAVQVASIAFPAFEAPAWVLRVFILMLIAADRVNVVEGLAQDLKRQPVKLAAIGVGVAALVWWLASD